MAITTFSELPVATGLTGLELICISQMGDLVVPWVTRTVTVAEVASFYIDPNAAAPTMRQLLQAMASQGVLVTAFDQLSADITNSNNIAWYHAFRMPLNDPFITTFLQGAIGYSNAAMLALYALAFTFPA